MHTTTETPRPRGNPQSRSILSTGSAELPVENDRGSGWLSRIPVVLALGMIIGLYLAPDRALKVPALLLPVLSSVFFTLASLLIAVLAARSFLAGGTPTVLLMGAGMLALGIASVLTSVLLSLGDANAGVTSYNIGVTLAGLANLAGALWMVLPGQWRGSWAARAWLDISYGSVVGMMALACWGATSHAIPQFYVDGQGPTPLRQMVLSTAIGAFALSGLLLAMANRQARSPFLRWYALGMLLLAIGLGGVFGNRAFDSALTWGGRATQYLGGVYLLTAVSLAVKQSRRWTIPLETLRETHQLYNNLVDWCPDAILMHSEGRYVFANPAAARLFGAASAQELIGRPVLELVHPDFRDQTAQRVREIITGVRHTPLHEVMLLRLDGARVEAEVVGAQAQYQGHPAVQLVVRDITERRRAQQALSESEELFRASFDESPIGAVIADPELHLIRVNAEYCRFLGYSDEELLKLKVADFSHPDDLEADMVQARQLVEGKIDRFQMDKRYVRKDKAVVWGRLSVRLVRNPDGQPRCCLAMIEDITARKQAEEGLRAAKAAAEAAGKAKDDFLAALSHELRTPLTPVLITVEGMRKATVLPPELAEDLTMIHRNLELEVRLIDDLLDLNRAVRGKIELHVKRQDVHATLESVMQICRSEIEAKRLSLQVDLQAHDHYLEGDPGRLQQIFWNIIKNAIKFTAAGGAITVRTRNPSSDAIVVEVTDSGIGMAPEDIARLFVPFQQAGRDVTRHFGGLGLGLAICRNLVDLHGGSVHASSPGRGLGATFSVQLPTVAAPAEQPEVAVTTGPVIAARPMAARILLVEDNQDTIRVMARLLNRMGHEVIPAMSVREALEAITRASAEVDLILSDLGLPDGSGHDLIRELRQGGYTLPAIALSGYGLEEDLRRSSEAGFTMHLTKPISPTRLAEAIATIMTPGSIPAV